MGLKKVVALSLLFISIAVARAQDSSHIPSYKFKPGKEVIAVYVGSSWCGPCQNPKFKKALGQLRERVSKEVQASGANFWTLGISVDNNIKAGYEFLKSAGPFDEISIGRSWANTAAVRFVMIDNFGGPVVPQVILIERHVEKEGAGIKITNEKVLLRLIGTGDILKWVSENKLLKETKTYKGIIIEQSSQE